jgi:pre-mRNA-processing factor 40
LFFDFCIASPQEFNKVSMDMGKTNASPLEEKTPDEEPLVFANKLVST